MNTYLAVYFGSAAVALLLTPMVICFAKLIHCVDKPNCRKVHASAIPRIGGVAIVLAMMLATIPIIALDNKIGQMFRELNEPLTGLFLGAMVIFLAGLVDDVRELGPWQKLGFQLIAAIIVCSAGVRITEIGITDNYTLHFGWISWPITFLWIIGITNAVNLIDGLDGLAAGVCAITCGVIAAFAIYNNQPVMAVIMLAMLGSLSGFLVFNFNPAKIFMGDSGSLFLGFVLSCASVISTQKTTTIVGLAIPILALGIPIFDTFFSMLRRILERRSLFAPDRSHIHHRLLDKGFKHSHAVILMYIVTLICAGIGLSMMVIRGKNSILLFAGASVLLIIVFRAVGAVRLFDSIAILKQNFKIARQTSEEKRHFENVQLYLKRAKTFDEWWSGICKAASELDFLWLSIDIPHRNGTIETLVWRPEKLKCASTSVVNLNVPVSHRRVGPKLEMEIGVRVNGSLESAGRRASLFIRLIDEYSLARLPSNPAETQDSIKIIHLGLQKRSCTPKYPLSDKSVTARPS